MNYTINHVDIRHLRKISRELLNAATETEGATVAVPVPALIDIGTLLSLIANHAKPVKEPTKAQRERQADIDEHEARNTWQKKKR